MTTFTLDTNCIIALENSEPAAAALRQLVAAHTAGTANVALVNVSASERQRGDRYIANYSEFLERTKALGLDGLTMLGTITYWNFSFYGLGTYGTAPGWIERERQVHEALFPDIPFLWQDFVATAGIDVNDTTATAAKTWRNAFCDRQMYWAHDNQSRDVFVTSDSNFRRKLVGHPHFPTAKVLTPDAAALLL